MARRGTRVELTRNQGGWPPSSNDVVRTVRHPGSLKPIDHYVGDIQPDERVGEYEKKIDARVEALALSGALDELTKYALDEEIGSWRDSWGARARQHASNQRRVQEELNAQTLQNLKTHSEELRQLNEQRAELEALEDKLQESLGSTGGNLEAIADALHRPGWTEWLRWGLLVPFAAADVWLAIPAFNRILGGDPLASFFCAAVFAAVTTLAAFVSGNEAKYPRKAVAILVGAVPVALVIGLFILRIYAGSLEVTVSLGAAEPENPVLKELPIAIGMAILMLAVSALAWADGYATSHSGHVRRLVNIAKQLTKAKRREAAKLGMVERLTVEREFGERAIVEIEVQLQEALDHYQALARQLQEYAQTQITIAVGNPTMTSGPEPEDTK